MYEENKEARGMTYTGLETYVQQAAFDQTLTRLYGAEGAEKAHSRCMEVRRSFIRPLDRPAEALFSSTRPYGDRRKPHRSSEGLRTGRFC